MQFLFNAQHIVVVFELVKVWISGVQSRVVCYRLVCRLLFSPIGGTLSVDLKRTSW